ncbi:MAG TPA: carboxypeptidase regulatory-like domain-containing protein, partial [Acidobacteriaceae bacterium]
MKISPRSIVLFLIFSCLVLSGAHAQQGSAVTGSLTGSVTDTSGALISGATVTVTGPQGVRTAKSDSLGRYAIDNLVPGYYDVTAEASGFKRVESKHNEVVVNVASNLNLKLAVGSTAEVVEVNASAIPINTESNAIDANLTDTFYNSVPIPRNVSGIFYAAPGVVTSQSSSVAQVGGLGQGAGPGAANPSIGGASGLENLYVVDGVTITDQAFGSLGTFNRFHGALGSGVNLAFIKEVDVKSGGFEPQYGKGQGGIVQIVTKSGSNQFHGALAAYFGPGKWYADRYQYYQFGFIQTTPASTFSNPQYDASAEFGGYVPHLQNRMFFFGAIDPGLSQYINQANPRAPLFAHGPYAYSTTVFNWAAKLTYKMSDASQIEGSTFADPSRHNQVPNDLSAANAPSVTSAYNYGSRDSVLRLNVTLSPTWLFTTSYTYNFNHFNEIPSHDYYQITDQSGLPLPTVIPTTVTGLGGLEPSNNNTYSLSIGTQKIAHFHGEHTFSIGYTYDHTNFLDHLNERSGPLFPIPHNNALGVPLTTLFSNIPKNAPGSLTNALFTLAAANTSNYLDNTCTMCPKYRGERVYLTMTRGTYSSAQVLAQGIYKTAYANDNWQINRYITLMGGVRWEQQRTSGKILSYVFTGNWSPRLGISIDPIGDRRTKIFFNYGTYVWAMPLDAAIRQLGNELDDTSFAFAPAADSAGNLLIGPSGGPIPVLDDAHVLNGLPRRTVNGVVGNFGAPNFASSTGEGILPGTKSEYEAEYLIGVERELTPGLVVKARYTDRRLPRIIEDIGSQSPEGSTIGANYNGGIFNPKASTDLWVNEAEITYTPAQYAAANPAGSKGYHPPVPGCTSKNDTIVPVGGLFTNALNQPLGGACFTNLATMDNPPPDGKPDGFVNPVRRYQALELEVDKRFSNHWMAAINYRFGKLWGNYEGAYRNDNGQSDPGISSLFDFTAGQLGLLGDQFKPGFLNTDRRNVGNLFLSYNVGPGNGFFGHFHGLTGGLGLRGQSGNPLSKYGDHPIYLSQGEIPVGGRGTAGRLPSTMQLDLHTDYPITFKEKYAVKLAFDAFNVTNSQFLTGKVQYLQQRATGVGVAPVVNQDFGRPS